MRKYGFHIATFGLFVLAISLGIAFSPKILAQRVAETPQKADTLKTLTLDAKGGTNTSATPQAGLRPKPLTRAQRLALFNGRPVISSLLLSPEKPIFIDKAWIEFHGSRIVSPINEGLALLYAESTSNLYLRFKVKNGELYALDFTVASWPDAGTATYSITNSFNPGATQSLSGNGEQHITAYVRGEHDHWLGYILRCSKNWVFYSVEVTEL